MICNKCAYKEQRKWINYRCIHEIMDKSQKTSAEYVVEKEGIVEKNAVLLYLDEV